MLTFYAEMVNRNVTFVTMLGLRLLRLYKHMIFKMCSTPSSMSFDVLLTY